VTMSTMPSRSEQASAPLRGADFRRVTSQGDRAVGRALSLYVCRREDESLRAGFTAGRRVGGAVGRNRARRLMREAWRAVSGSIAPGFDLVFVARASILEMGMSDVAAEMKRLLGAAGVLV
jgi:ribonuclease P protein component